MRTLKTKKLFGSPYLAPHLQANLQQQIASPNGTRQKTGIQLLPDPSIISVKMKGLPKPSPFSLLRLSLRVESDSAAPRTAAQQAPLAVRFPREDTGAGCHVLLQGVFPTWGSPRLSSLLPWQAGPLPPSPPRSPQSHWPLNHLNRMTNSKASNQPGEQDSTSC